MRVATLKKPCHNTRNRAFTSPATSPDNAVRAALRICEMCPTRVDCAKQALTAGSSLDGSTRGPAADVIQAGVICQGDEETAVALSRVAGVAPPPIREKKRRRQSPTQCRECAQPMTSWTRGEVPEGTKMHHARGWCVDCRSHYAEYMRKHRAARPVEATRKQTDRKRHHPETALARLRTRARVEGWSEEEVAVEVARIEEEKQREYDAVRADAARHGWELTTREVAELVGVTKEVVNNRGYEGRLPRRRWKGVAGYLYKLDDVVEMWPDA